MGRGSAWEAREVGVLPPGTAEAAAIASRAAHRARGGDRGGKSTAARERYEIMYGRALQPPGGVLPWSEEKAVAPPNGARAAHEKKYYTNIFAYC